MPQPDSVDDIIQRVEALKSERSLWESWWAQLAFYCLPRKRDFISQQPSGQKYPANVYDTTARRSLNIMAAGFMSHMTSPARRWFMLRFGDPATQQNQDAAKWLDDVEDAVYDVLASSNFYTQIHELYLDFGTFGTVGMYSEDDPLDRVRYYARPISELLFEEDAGGRIVRVYRAFKLTCAQAYDEWGDAAGENVTKAYAAKKLSQEFEFIHAVGKRAVRDAGKDDAPNKEYYSKWINKDQKHLIREGGYNEMPFHIVRFDKKTGEKHGYSPAMDALPDIKMVNQQKETLIRAGQKLVDPPLEVPHDGFMMPISMEPSAINYRESSLNPLSDHITPINTEGNIPIGIDLIKMTQEDIRAAFFADMFLLLAGVHQNMTATEVVERIAERMLIVGPVIGRLSVELLTQVIARTVNILARQGAIPPPPPGVPDDYKVEYVSELALAQKAVELTSLTEWLTFVAMLAQADPNVFDLIDLDEMVTIAARIKGVDPDLLRNEEDVLGRRQERNQFQQMQAILALANQTATTAKTGAEAMKTEQESGAAVTATR